MSAAHSDKRIVTRVLLMSVMTQLEADGSCLTKCSSGCVWSWQSSLDCVPGVDTHFRQLCSDCWHNSQLSQPSALGCSAPAPVTVTLSTGHSPRCARSDIARCPRVLGWEFRESETERERGETGARSATGHTAHSCRVTQSLSESAGDKADQPGPLCSPVPSLRSPHWPMSAPGQAPSVSWSLSSPQLGLN